MASFVRCPNCGGKNYDTATHCEKCGINLRLTETEREQVKNLLVVTAQSIEGRMIKEYHGVVASVVVLGVGFKNESSAADAQLDGTRSVGIQDKMNQAVDAGLTELKFRAAERDADAIIAVDITTYRNDMLVVSCNGTAVRLVE